MRDQKLTQTEFSHLSSGVPKMAKNGLAEHGHKHFDGGGNDKHGAAKAHLGCTTYHNGRESHNFGYYCINCCKIPQKRLLST